MFIVIDWKTLSTLQEGENTVLRVAGVRSED